MWGKGMDINPEDETSYTTQCQESFLKYVQNKYFPIHRPLPGTIPANILNNNHISSAMAPWSRQSCCDQYDLSSDIEGYLMSNTVAEMTPGQRDHTAHLLTATRHSFNSYSESPQNWGQLNLNPNDYHSDPRGISCTFWLPDITYWWQ